MDDISIAESVGGSPERYFCLQGRHRQCQLSDGAKALPRRGPLCKNANAIRETPFLPPSPFPVSPPPSPPPEKATKKRRPDSTLKSLPNHETQGGFDGAYTVVSRDAPKVGR